MSHTKKHCISFTLILELFGEACYKMSSAVRTFKLDEVLRLILMEVFLKQDTQIDLNQYRTCTDLVSVASTCKTFRDVATDIIWRVQTSLEPLFHCFGPRVNYFVHGSDYGLEDIEVLFLFALIGMILILVMKKS